jgi:predicted secreted protein
VHRIEKTKLKDVEIFRVFIFLAKNISNMTMNCPQHGTFYYFVRHTYIKTQLKIYFMGGILKMKKMISILLTGIMVFSCGVVFADKEANIIKPQCVINNLEKSSTKFNVSISGDEFKIDLKENPSTGYIWSYAIDDEEHVTFMDEKEIRPEIEIPGAGGNREFAFEINGDGVSTITFTLRQSWENEPLETLRVLVHKNGEEVFVQEDEIVNIIDGNNEEIYKNIKMTYNDKEIETELAPVKVDGVMMMPLSVVAKNMGYNVIWNGQTKAVEISKGSQWTSVTVGKNEYFRNKIAPQKLSSAPKIVENRMYVPVEFVVEVLGKGIRVEEGNLRFYDGEMAIHSGYVTHISYDETGAMTITISQVKDSTDPMDTVVIHTSYAYTYYNKTVEKGALIRVISPMMMTKSLPPQTSGHIVY